MKERRLKTSRDRVDPRVDPEDSTDQQFPFPNLEEVIDDDDDYDGDGSDYEYVPPASGN